MHAERARSRDVSRMMAPQPVNPPWTAIHLQALCMHTALRCPGTQIYTCRLMIYMHARVRSTAVSSQRCGVHTENPESNKA